MTSACHILPVQAPPYLVVIDRRCDEVTSYRYLPPPIQRGRQLSCPACQSLVDCRRHHRAGRSELDHGWRHFGKPLRQFTRREGASSRSRWKWRSSAHCADRARMVPPRMVTGDKLTSHAGTALAFAVRGIRKARVRPSMAAKTAPNRKTLSWLTGPRAHRRSGSQRVAGVVPANAAGPEMVRHKTGSKGSSKTFLGSPAK